MKYFFQVIFIIFIINIFEVFASDLIKWRKYDAKSMKPAIKNYYKYSWDAKILVPRVHSELEESGETFEIYVRKFSRNKIPMKHLWLISGGPGSSSSGIERALDVMLPDTAIYLMDNRGLGESHPMCLESESGVCQKNPKKCYDSLKYSSKHISLHETAKDYNYISRLILKSSGGKVYMYGSSYGAILAYTSFKFDPFLYSGLLMEAFIPGFKLDEDADVRKHVVSSCFKSETCHEALGKLTKIEAEGMMEKIMKEETNNPCKSALEFLAQSSGHKLNSLLNSYIRVSFYRKTGMRSVLIPILYGVAYCPNVEGYNEILSDFHEAYLKSNEKNSELMLLEPLNLSGMHGTEGGVTNNFFGGHIRYSEFINDSEKKFQKCQEKGYLNSSNWADVCGMVTDYNEEYLKYLYEPKLPKTSYEILEKSPTRLVFVTGKLDTQTPHDLAEKEFNELGVIEKYMFTADHAGHGVIDSWEVPDMKMDLLLSFTMTGNENDKFVIEEALRKHNNQPERIWKHFDKQIFGDKNIWDFKEKELKYSLWKFLLIICIGFIPIIITIILVDHFEEEEKL